MPRSVTFELDDATLQTLDRLAERTERSRDDLISQAVQEIARIVEKYSTPA